MFGNRKRKNKQQSFPEKGDILVIGSPGSGKARSLIIPEIMEDCFIYPWIPCDIQLPEEKENPITKDYFVYPVIFHIDDITDIRYYAFGKGHWWHGPQIMDEYVTHWLNIQPPKQETTIPTHESTEM